jgi:glycosyltransferase involved in cell wall biosynthesis
MITLVRSLTADVVHFHTGNSCLPRSLTTALALTRSSRAFVTVHSPYETIEATSFRGRFWGWSTRVTLHAVVSPSNHASTFQRRCGVPTRRAVTIRNAIHSANISGGDGTLIRAELSMTVDQPLIVFTSRIDDQKRPIDAVRILAEIIDEHPEALLAFVGSGDSSDAVLTEAARLGLSDNVRAVGFRTDVPDWLAASTVWLLPTERENFSVAVLEALAAGCAVVTTDCPGNDEIIVDGENALSFAVGDIEGGADAVRRLLADSTLRSRLADGARSSTRDLTIENMIDQYRDLYVRFTGSG